MKRVMSRPRLILLFTFVILVAHTFAETPEALKNAFTLNRQRHREARRLAGPSTTNYTEPTGWNFILDANWAGAVQELPPSGTFTKVQAQWVVPDVTRPNATGAGTWVSPVFVGFDGWPYNCLDDGVLQAGTFSYVDVDSTGNVTTGASVWVEWSSVPVIELNKTVPVAAGQTIKVSITATNSSQATVIVNNLSTGDSATAPISSPNTANNICGQSTHWIVVDPFVNYGNGLAPMAQFSPIRFESCAANTTTSASASLVNAKLPELLRV